MFSVSASGNLGKRARAGDDAPARDLTPEGVDSTGRVADPIFQDILAELEGVEAGSDLQRILRIKVTPASTEGLNKGPSFAARQVADPIFQDILAELEDVEEDSDLHRILGIEVSDLCTSGAGGGGSGSVTDPSSLTAKYLKGEIDRIFNVFSVWGQWIASRSCHYDYTDAEKAIDAIVSDLSCSEDFQTIATTSSVPLARAVMERLFLDGILVEGSKHPTYKAPFWEIILGLICFEIPGQVNPFLDVISSMGKDPIFNIISQKKVYSDCIDVIFHELANHQKVPLSFSEREQAWLTIAKGWDENTRSERPPVEFYETVSRQTSEERQRMYDAAYFVYHYPFLHEPVDPAQDISADAYSINMLWLHALPQKEDGGLLYPEFEAAMAAKALEWGRSNPGTEMNLWYDGERVSSAAVERSGKKIREMGGDGRIVFRNIRELPNDPMFCRDILSKEEFNTFFAKETDLSEEAVYPRVDALKVLIANYLGRQGRTSLCVDVDCMSLAKAEIFCKRTMSQLRHSGIVMAAKDEIYENGFVITYPRHPGIVEWCKKVFDKALIKLKNKEAEEGLSTSGDFYVEYYDLLQEGVTWPPGCIARLPVKPVPLPDSQFS